MFHWISSGKPLCARFFWIDRACFLSQLVTMLVSVFVVSAHSWNARAACTVPPGDINGSGVTTVTDVQCGILTVIWTLKGALPPHPDCIAGPVDSADVDCDESIVVTDILLVIGWSLGEPLSVQIDANQNNCPDMCDAGPTDPLTIQTLELPDGAVQKPYSAILETTGAIGGTTWALVSGDLPPGIVLNAASGQLVGTPAQTGVWPVTFSATDSSAEPQSTTGAFSIVIRSLSTEIIQSDPIAYWRFGEPAGSLTATDGTGNGHDGVYPTLGVTLGVPGSGALDTAVYLDGFDDSRIVVPSDPSLSVKKVSIEALVVPELQAEIQGRILERAGESSGKSARYNLKLNPITNAPNFEVSTTGGIVEVVGTPLLVGVPVHLIGTYDGQQVRLYVDGELSGSAPLSGDIWPSDQPLGLGNQVERARPFHGILDEVVLYDRALGADEIAIHAASIAPVVSPLEILTTTLPDGFVGIPYQSQVIIVGGFGTKTISVVSGTLPPGLSMTDTGIVSGTPTTGGNYTIMVQVEDGMGAVVTQTITAKILGCDPVIDPDCTSCTVDSDCPSSEFCGTTQTCVSCDQSSHCGDLPHCGYFCLSEPLSLVAEEITGFNGTLQPRIDVFGDRDAYWLDDPEGHFVVSLVGAPGFADDVYPDNNKVAQIARLTLLSGTNVLQTLDLDATWKLEVVLDVGALDVGAHTLKGELLGTDGSVLATASRTFEKHAKNDEVAEFPDDGVPIIVHKPKSIPPGPSTYSWPLSTGVPFPKFAVESLDTLGLFETGPDGTPVQIPAQLTERSRWYRQRGGVRWAGLDFIAKADVIAGEYVPRTYVLKTTMEPPAPTALEVHFVTAAGIPCDPNAAPQVCPIIEIDTGPARFHINRFTFSGVASAWLDTNADGAFTPAEQVVSGSGGPYWVDQNNVRYDAKNDTAANVFVDEVGSVKAVVIAEGVYKSPNGSLKVRFYTSLTAYAGDTTIRIAHRANPHMYEKDGMFSDLGFDVGVPGAGMVHFGADETTLPLPFPGGGSSTFLHQETADHYRLEPGGLDGSRSDGWFAATASNGLGAAVFVRDIWQRFPTELEASMENGVPTLTAHAWPEHDTTPFITDKDGQPFDTGLLRENIHKLRYAHQGNLLRDRWDRSFERALACYNGSLKQTYGGDPESPLCPACPDPTQCAPNDTACLTCSEPPECQWCMDLMGAEDFYDNPDAGSLGEEFYLWFEYDKPPIGSYLYEGDIIATELALTLFPSMVLADIPEKCALFQEGPHGLPDPAYSVTTRAEGWLSARDPQTFPDEEHVMDNAFLDYRRVALEQGDMYGRLTWGQIFGDYHGSRMLPILHRISQASHYRNVFTPWLLYLRGNQPEMLDFARINSDLFMSANIFNVGPLTQDGTLGGTPYTFGAGSSHCKGFGPWNGGTWAAHWTDMSTPRMRWLLLGDTFSRDFFFKWGLLPRNHFYNYTESNNIRDTVTPFGEQLDYYMVTHDPEALVELARGRKVIFDDPNFQDWSLFGLHGVWNSDWVQRYYELVRDPVVIDRLMGVFAKSPELNSAAYLYMVTEDPNFLLDVLHKVRAAVHISTFDAPESPLHGFGPLFANPTRYYLQGLPRFLHALGRAQVKYPGLPWSLDLNDESTTPMSFPALNLPGGSQIALGIGLNIHRAVVPNGSQDGANDVELLLLEETDGPIDLHFHNITGLGDDGSARIALVGGAGALVAETIQIGPFAQDQTRSRPMDGTDGLHSLTWIGAQRVASPISTLPEVQIIRRYDPQLAVNYTQYALAGDQRWWVQSLSQAAWVTLELKTDLGKGGNYPDSGQPVMIRIESGTIPGKVLVDWSLMHGTGDPDRESIIVTLDPADAPWLFSSGGHWGPYLRLVDVSQTSALGLPTNPERIYLSRNKEHLTNVLTQLSDPFCDIPADELICADVLPSDPADPPTCGFVTDPCGRVIRCENASFCSNGWGQCSNPQLERCVSNHCVLAPACTQLLTNANATGAVTVDGTGPTNVWFAGGNSVVRFDGTTCTATAAPFSEMYALDVVGTNDVWASGIEPNGDGALAHFDGNDWTKIWSKPTARITKIQTTPNGLVYMVDSWTGDIYVVNGTTVSVVPKAVSTFYAQAVFAVADNDLWVGGMDSSSFPTGVIRRIVQETDTPMLNGSEFLHIWNISAISPDDIWFGGKQVALDYPQILHWDGTSLKPDEGAPTFPAYGLHALPGGLVWAVGPDGVHRRLASGDWMREELPLSMPYDLLDVWASGPNDVWAVGGQRNYNCFKSPAMSGIVLHWDGVKWELR